MSSTPRFFLLATLPVLSVLGFYNTFYTARLNGTGRLLFSVLKAGPEGNFPGTEFPLLRTYTGIPQVDRVLALLVAFFAHAVDGSLDGYGRWGLGQFGAAWSLILMEGLRNGNKGRIVSWTGLFGLLIQIFSFTFITPIYLLISLLTSPAVSSAPSKESLLIPSRHLTVLPYTVVISYVVPSLLMALNAPEHVSSTTLQRLIAVWQFFPAISTITHYLLTSIFTSKTPKEPQTTDAYLEKAHSTRLFIILVAGFPHLFSLISSLAVDGQSFSRTFVPFSFTYSAATPVPDLATGVKNFLQWDIYIGLTSVLLWSIYLYWDSREVVLKKTNIEIDEWQSVAALLLVGGPMGFAAFLLNERDSFILERAAPQGLEVDTVDTIDGNAEI